ncbi:unnamed protein product [Rotaria sordida]|nr:unnamed protein product [Rotaria sordida]CAF1293682.1 unnamed protein product [Rotaria sordida]CAF3947700.1 unnamed protein product [Rotaria sordida]CAF3949737.1 unnamed protein product [Rotaria sordida]CAF4025629.1 unnamed protein product [Rotaria sordida]
MESVDEARLNQCLTSIIEKINAVLKELGKRRGTVLKSDSSKTITIAKITDTTTIVATDDRLLDNILKNNIVNTFTVDNEENELLDTLTHDIQNIFRNFLPQLSTMCTSYIEQHLHQYHFNQERVFTQALTTGILYTFKHDLSGLLLAARAYPAAFNGDIKTVDNFLKRYPMYKDKPGFWKTTLIYSAARNNHLRLIKYLIETARCSVNAQNQSEIAYVVIADSNTTQDQQGTLGYKPDPTAAATALHAACFNNNLDIVKYLISKGANYFKRNQLGETPIQNSVGHEGIQNFFNDYLVSAYIDLSYAPLPNETILNCYDRRPNNCIWEYKPVKGFEWKEFTVTDNSTLCAALIPGAKNQSFNTTIYLSARPGTYSVQLLTFLRGSKNQEPNPPDKDGLAWIRCRGSSIANFDIHCIWQLMFVKYNTKKQSQTLSSEPPSLDAKTFPSVYDSKFQIKLNSWYTCDSKRNALLDDTMNYRRRYVDIDCNFDINYNENTTVKCNLYTFTFTNSDKTILGFIRWIPKLIVNTPNDQNSIKILDNFKMINNFNPTPLTTKRLEQFNGSKSTMVASMTTTEDNENEETNPMTDLAITENEVDDDDDDDENSACSTSSINNLGTWSITDLLSSDFQSPTEHHDLASATKVDPVPDIPIPSINACIDEKIGQPTDTTEKITINKVSEANNRAEQDEAARKAQAAMEFENEQLKAKIIILEREVEEKTKNLTENDATSAAKLSTTKDRLKDLQKELNAKAEKENLIKKTAEQISTAQYTVPKSNQSILSKFNLIINTLRKLSYPLKEYFKDNIPLIDLDDDNDGKITVKGFPIHHQELQKILERWQKLIQQGQSAEKYYDQKTNKNIQSLLRTIHRVHPKNPIYWKPYCNSLVKLINQKYDSYVEKFKNRKSTLLPALLVAEGYDRIIVTQPRRLPCDLISQRVNSMINDNISGWAVSGKEHNVQAKILYMTDGLLKERLLNDDNFITENTHVKKSVVFLIDEVHERSINIDICLALFARLLKLKPALKTKLKVIISSATLDSSVPALYRNIPGCPLIEFNLVSLSTLYTVTVNDASKENLLDLVQKLYSKRNRHDQILCFVGSTLETLENCRLINKITKGAIVAYPLIQSQSAIDQQKYIEQGTVFFSTTVAETSLTFPCLKYVIDTGLINMPVYSLQLERTELQEIKAAESTTKQRRGRLGRTQPGEYYALYDYAPDERRKYPVPQICQSELVNIEFALRRSRLKTSLKEFQQYLPDKPKKEYIHDALKQLQRLGFISSSSNESFTNLGASIAKLPDFGSLPMSKAVYAALKQYSCGRDLIVLSSILSVLNTSAILKSIPIQYKRPEGDFMTLLQVMNTILMLRDAVPSKQFNLDRVCDAKGLSAAAHVINPALRRYKNLDKAFSLSDEFRELARVQSGNWENIAKALLNGFSDKVYASLKMLQGKAQQFVKYNVNQRRSNNQQQDSLNEVAEIAVIDRSSTLRTGNKGALPAPLVIARDVCYLTAVRSVSILSFVGQLESSWLEYIFSRELQLNGAEEKKLKDENILQKAIQRFPQVQIQVNNRKLVFCGLSGHILNAELYVRQQLVTVLNFTLVPDYPNKPNDNLTRNLKSITSMPGDLFGPLRWRWESERQVKIRTKMHKNNGTIEVAVEGIDSQNQAVYREFMSFLSWLRTCAVIRYPNSGK